MATPLQLCQLNILILENPKAMTTPNHGGCMNHIRKNPPLRIIEPLYASGHMPRK